MRKKTIRRAKKNNQVRAQLIFFTILTMSAGGKTQKGASKRLQSELMKLMVRFRRMRGIVSCAAPPSEKWSGVCLLSNPEGATEPRCAPRCRFTTAAHNLFRGD